MKIARTRNVSFPERGTQEAAGIDIFIPMIDESFIKEFESKNSETNAYLVKNDKYFDGKFINYIAVRPNSKVMIPTGLKVSIDRGTALMGGNKSGIAWKNSLVLTANVIDSDYKGEVFLAMYNLSESTVLLSEGQKVAQLLHIPIILETINEVDEDYILYQSSERGEGALGSTGLFTK